MSGEFAGRGAATEAPHGAYAAHDIAMASDPVNMP